MSNENKFTAYITKYALTQGILEVQAELCGPEMIRYYIDGCYDQYMYGNDFHRSRFDAVGRANAMQYKKIASLKKKIEELEAMRFE